MSVTAGALLGESQEQGLPSGPPTWMMGTQVLDPSSPAFCGVPQQAVGIGSRAAGTWRRGVVFLSGVSMAAPIADSFVNT